MESRYSRERNVTDENPSRAAHTPRSAGEPPAYNAGADARPLYSRFGQNAFYANRGFAKAFGVACHHVD